MRGEALAPKGISDVRKRRSADKSGVSLLMVRLIPGV